jgi:hypothetical protein
MHASKAIRKRLAATLAVLAILAIPALTWGDDSKPKKAAAPAPAPKPAPAPAARPAPAAAHPTGSRPAGPGGGTAPNTTGNRPGTTRTPTGSHPPLTTAESSASRGTHAVTPNRVTKQVQIPGGKTATVLQRSNGRIATIQANGMTINHPLRGPRTVVAKRNGATIVAMGRQGGYVQRPYFSRGGKDYVQRTYVVNGVSQVAVYRSYTYGGVAYYGYVPAYYYSPAYYGWAYDAWAAPVAYGPAAWGWAGAPWYGFYGGYFTPYPAYANASQWLTDYLLAANLQAAYAATAETAPAGAPPPADASAAQPSRATQLTPEVKQMIAEQVKQQLAAEQAAAHPQQSAAGDAQTPDALNPAERIFIVHVNVEAASAAGKECQLTPGDVVMRMTDTPDENQNVNASVQSSKKTDCASGQTIVIAVQELQEMHNQFRQHVDSGLTTLASNAGKGGLPQAPDATTTAGEVPAPKPISGAASQLAGAQQEADATEQAVQNGSSGS